jgi:hypothetical protein
LKKRVTATPANDTATAFVYKDYTITNANKIPPAEKNLRKIFEPLSLARSKKINSPFAAIQTWPPGAFL